MKKLICPLLSSALYILAFPKFSIAGFAWVALVPLMWQVQGETTPTQAFGYGLLSGTFAYAGLLYWLIPTFQAAGQGLALSVPALLLLSAYLGLYWGLWTWMIHRFPSRRLLPFFAAAAWVALEYARTYFLSGFPWALFADSQVTFLPLIQMATVTGAYGVSFILVFVNVIWFDVWERRWTVPCVTGTVLMLGMSLGVQTLKHGDIDGKAIPVALLQGNIDQYKKWSAEYVEEIKTTFERLAHEANAASPRLVIWPETSMPGYLLQEPSLQNWLVSVIQKGNAEHLIGTPLSDGQHAWNSAILIGPQNQMLGMYMKRHLVPFGEAVPFQSVLGRWIPVLNALGGFTPGGRMAPLQSSVAKLGVSICYEAILPNFVRKVAANHINAIVNITNDSCFFYSAIFKIIISSYCLGIIFNYK